MKEIVYGDNSSHSFLILAANKTSSAEPLVYTVLDLLQDVQ